MPADVQLPAGADLAAICQGSPKLLKGGEARDIGCKAGSALVCPPGEHAMATKREAVAEALGHLGNQGASAAVSGGNALMRSVSSGHGSWPVSVCCFLLPPLRSSMVHVHACQSTRLALAGFHAGHHGIRF